MSIKNAGIFAFCAIAAGTLGAPLGRADLIANGGFCTGSCAPNGDFTGWTTTAAGDPYYTNTIDLAPGTYAAQIGAYYDDSNPANVIQGSIAQTLSTVVGQQYTLSFLYGEYNNNISSSAVNPVDCAAQNGCYLDPGNTTGPDDSSTNPYAQVNNLNVLFGGSSVYGASNFFTSAISGPNNTDGGKSIGDYFLQEGTAIVTATSTSTTLEFDAKDFQQGAIITDVSLEAVSAAPEPGTIGLLGSALLGLGLLARRSRR
jgi:PEP-CTERM motif